MNPKKMAQMMKKMGVQQSDIPATEVIIKTAEKEIVIPEPQVAKVNMMGQETYQISGEAFEREKFSETTVSEDDIAMVMEQTSCSREEAEKVLKETGDLAQAIMQLGDQ